MKSAGWGVCCACIGTLLIWLATLPTLGINPASGTARLAYQYQPLQSGVLRFYARTHITSVTVNGAVIALPGWYNHAQGEKKLVTIDISRWLPTGDDPVTVQCITQDHQVCEIKLMHSTASMMLAMLMFLTSFTWSRLPRFRAAVETHVRGYGMYWPIPFLFALAFFLHMRFMEFESSDYELYLEHWIEFIQRRGFAIYRENFTNYSPLYTYFLGLSDLLFPTLNSLYTVKLVTFTGEILAAIWAFRLLRLHCGAESPVPAVAAMLLLLCPSVLADGASAAQCDIWYAAFLLAMIYCLVQRDPTRAMAYCGLAFSFKLQTTFMAPLLLTCLLKRVIPWNRLWIPPAIYVLTCLPAWLAGRPLMDLLTIYLSQAGGASLSYNAPNFYHFFELYNHSRIVPAGIACALLATALIAFASARTCRMAVPDMLLLSTLCGGLIPFLLPKMHDRYFFLADVFSLLLCCMRPEWFFICACFQLASVMAYPASQLETIADIPGWNQDFVLNLAMCLNIIAISCLLWLCRRELWSKRAVSLRQLA